MDVCSLVVVAEHLVDRGWKEEREGKRGRERERERAQHTASILTQYSYGRAYIYLPCISYCSMLDCACVCTYVRVCRLLVSCGEIIIVL